MISVQKICRDGGTREKDYTSVLYETRITADQDRESIVRDICQNIISNGK